MKTILATGGFDPVHIGHVQMFKEAGKLADKVVVLLNSDDWLIRKKGKAFMDAEHRKSILEEMKILMEGLQNLFLCGKDRIPILQKVTNIVIIQMYTAELVLLLNNNT